MASRFSAFSSLDTELVFELMDLSLARTYQEAIRKDDQAALALWKFINTYQDYPVAESYRELEANKVRSALGVISAAVDWHSWRLAWSRIVP